MDRPLVVRQPVRGAVWRTGASLGARIGNAGGSLKLLFSTRDDSEQVESTAQLRPATAHRSTSSACANSFGRLGGTPSRSARSTRADWVTACFFPMSELNHMRQAAVAALTERRGWSDDARRAERTARIGAAVTPPAGLRSARARRGFHADRRGVALGRRASGREAGAPKWRLTRS